MDFFVIGGNASQQGLIYLLFHLMSGQMPTIKSTTSKEEGYCMTSLDYGDHTLGLYTLTLELNQSSVNKEELGYDSSSMAKETNSVSHRLGDITGGLV